jgi:hypothetical protein
MRAIVATRASEVPLKTTQFHMRPDLESVINIVIVLMAVLLTPAFFHLVKIRQVVEQISWLRAAMLGAVTMCGLFLILSRVAELARVLLGSFP